MEQKKCIILIGLPCSGKTWFFWEKFKDFTRFAPEECDTKFHEKMEFGICFKSTTSFVVDSTNHTREARKRYIVMAKAMGFHVVGYYFQPDLDASIELNENRKRNRFGLKNVVELASFQAERLGYYLDEYAISPPADMKKVGTPKKKMTEKRIREIYDEMEEPSYDEEFDELYLTYFDEDHFETEPWA